MRKKPTKESYVPVIHCDCGYKGPLSCVGPFVHKSKKIDPIYIWFCPNCDRVPVDDDEIKGYMSIKEMKNQGWKKVRPKPKAAKKKKEPRCG